MHLPYDIESLIAHLLFTLLLRPCAYLLNGYVVIRRLLRTVHLERGAASVLGTLGSLLSRKPRGPWSTVGKVIVVVGASSGIGAAVARQIAEAVASDTTTSSSTTTSSHSPPTTTLILCARRMKELEAVAEQCRKACPGRPLMVHAHQVDIADAEQVRTFIVEKIGTTHHRIDALILNAGLSMGETLLEMSTSHSDRGLSILDTITTVNYLGLVHCAVHALPLLRDANGEARVVVVSSLLGEVAGPTRSFYCGSKFALRGFFDAFRGEMLNDKAMEHVSVTMVYPGRVQSDLNAGRLGNNPARFDAKKSMTAREAAEIVVEALHKPWIRDAYFGVQGKLLAAVKGVACDAADWIMRAVLNRVQGKGMKVE